MKNLLKSFRHAYEGLSQAIRKERNLKIHMIFAISVLILGLIFNISSIEYTIILLTIGGMIALELINTAIERVVDLATDTYHPLAKAAKDIAAAACLVFAILSCVIGVIIFLPKIFL